MRSLLIVCFCAVLFTASVEIALSQSPATLQRERARNAIPENDLQRRMTDMRALDPYARRRSERDRKELEELVPPEYDKETKDRIRKMRVVNDRDIARFANLLSQPKTGIFRIFQDLNCLTDRVISVRDECEKFVPSSTDFTFRFGEYASPMFHDIGFRQDKLVSNSIYAQGIFVDLGKTPLDTVTMETPGAKALWNIAPAASHTEAAEQAKIYAANVTKGDITFTSSVEPIAERSMLLRVIAYRSGNVVGVLREDSTVAEMKFKSLDNDARDDILVAFRIIRVAVDGGLTIVWKELARREAPKLKLEKKDRLTDFK